MASYIVTTLNDELDSNGAGATIADMGGINDLSLREALFLANQNAATADTITFNVAFAGGTLRLTQGELVITSDVSIDGDVNGDNRADIVITGDANGDDATTTDSFGNVITNAATNANTADNSRVFNISGAGTSASLSSLVVTGGVVGGGIRVGSGAALTLEHASIAGNSAHSGGGISNIRGALTVNNSIIAGNVASFHGGAIYSATNTTGSELTTVANTTISGNNADYGGGLFNVIGRSIVQNTTISGNSAATSGGGISSRGNAYTFTDVESTIVAANTAGTAGSADVALYEGGTNSFTNSPGNNLVGNGNSLFTNGVNGNIVGATGALVDPLLGPLANNGGPVETMLLQSTSQAIDNGSNPASLATDARGVARNVDLNANPNDVDIGAVELQQLSPPTTPQAFVVTTLDDELDFAGPDANMALMGGLNDLSLREALFLANQDAATADTITFNASLAGGVLRLTQGQLSIAGDVSIDGDTDGDNRADIVITGDANGDDATTTDSFGNVITDAATNTNTADNSRVFAISGAGTDASLSGLVVTGGVASGVAASNNSGAGIRVGSGAALTLEHASIAGNSAFRGGGIANDSSVLTVRNSTIAGNIAANRGGGIFSNTNTTGSQLTTIVNTTISGNGANDGGGIFNLDGRTIVQNTTISGNNATTSGGGVSSWGDSITFTDVVSTIIAANTAGTAGSTDVALHNGGTNSFTNSPGNNLVGNGNSLFTNGVSGNIVGATGALVDPRLGPLANNGGPVETMLLQSTSQAIDNGSNPASLATDARGVARNVDLNANPNNVDIGAVELQLLSPPTTPQAFEVTTLNDELDFTGADATIANMGGLSDLSLREALFLANQNASTADTIAFDASLAGGTLRLTQGQLTIKGDVSISGDTDGDNRADIVITGDANGDDATTTDSFGNVITDAIANATGNALDNFRVFAITGLGTSASLSSLVVTGGRGPDGVIARGGGIYVDSGAVLTLEHATIAGNESTFGGGIANSSGVLTVRNSTIIGNESYSGGGIYSNTNTTGTELTTIVNTTISGNLASKGAGIHNGDGRTIVQSSTISGNRAWSSGGGILSFGNASTYTDVESTIIAANISLSSHYGATDDVTLRAGSTNSFANSPGNNLIGDGNGLFTNGVNGNIVGSTGALVDPLLGPLANNGGPVETMALLTGSLAIDNGSNPAGLPGDARGVFREVGSDADIGAFETQAATPYADILIGSASGDAIDGLGGNDIITGLAGDDTIIGGLGVDNLDGGGNTAAGDTLAFADDGRGHTVDLAAGTSASNVTTLVNSGATTSTVLTDALAGNIYINVHSNAFPGGELRGQLSSVASDTTDTGGVRTVVFLVDPLLGTSEVPPNASAASGSAQAILVDDAGTVTFSVDIALAGLPAANITNAHFHTGAPGVNGPAATSIFTGATIADVVQFDTIAGFENVTGGRGNDTIFGDGGANVLNGGAGNDVINGRSGADTMNGGAGNDILFVDDAGDVVMEAVGEGGNDRVATNTNYALTAGAEIELFTTTATAGTAAINLTGNSFAQTIIGNAGNNRIADGAGAGADVLRGLGGDDFYVVYNSGATIEEKSSDGANDRLSVGIDFALADGVFIELFTTTSTGAITGIDLTGNAGSQTIVGNAANNTISDGGGAEANGDLLKGLAGSDLYIVRNTGTVVQELAEQGSFDRVAVSKSYALAAGAEVESLRTTSMQGTNAINLTGNDFDQQIVGNAGANTLTGLGGNDTFFFGSTLGGGNIDTITDYDVADDQFELVQTIFNGIAAAGALDATAFVVNTTGDAEDAADRIIYNSDTGGLFYDADGVNGAAATQFATLTAGLGITAAEFNVV